jgi:hypothetical protein
MRSLSHALVFAGLATLVAAPLAAQTFPPTYLYHLDDDSRFEWGCFAPCVCPVLNSDAMAGSMMLWGSDVIDPGNPVRGFAVRDLRWKVFTGSQTVFFVGSGSYEIDQSANLHRLELDLGTNDPPPVTPSQHFSSGWVPYTGTMDNIDIDISVHGEFCRDTVVRVRSTLRTTDIPDRNSTLAASARPNPFGAATDVVFSLPVAGPVDVRVHDLAGRQVALLASGWRAAGPVTLSWDGRGSEGRVAPAGIYLVRIASAAGEATLRIARVP